MAIDVQSSAGIYHLFAGPVYSPAVFLSGNSGYNSTIGISCGQNYLPNSAGVKTYDVWRTVLTFPLPPGITPASATLGFNLGGLTTSFSLTALSAIYFYYATGPTAYDLSPPLYASAGIYGVGPSTPSPTFAQVPANMLGQLNTSAASSVTTVYIGFALSTEFFGRK